MKTPRSRKYLKWLRADVESRGALCQRCTAWDEGLLVPAHPPLRRPYGGGMGLKGSDYGVLMECVWCNGMESDNPAGAWLDPQERDRIVMSNLIRYLEYLDPSRDVHAEIMEWLQEQAKEAE